MMNAVYRITAVAAVALLIAACGGPPNNNPLLDEARVEVNAAGSDPAIVEGAPTALEKAETALRRGERLLEEGQDPEEIYHQAYLARQYVAIARETAELRAAEDEIKRAESERQRVLVDARERDAQRARQQAEEERRQAQTERERAEAALERARQLEEKVQELEAEATERGLVLTLSDVLFDVGRSTLKEGAQRTITRLAEFLRENPERRILIEGHTDNTGSYQLNINLSQSRAEAVKQALLNVGISGSRIRTAGLGPDYPVAGNQTAAGRQQNRRVEIIISDRGGTIRDRQ